MKNDVNKFFEFNSKCSDYVSKNVKGVYAVFQIKDNEGYIELPGKIIEKKEDEFLINLMDDGIDNSSSFSRWVPFNYIKGIQEFQIYDRTDLLNKFKEGKDYIITNTNNDKLRIKFISGNPITIEFYCKNKLNQLCLTSYSILLIKDIYQIKDN